MLMYMLVVLVAFMPNMRRFQFTPLPGVNLLNIFFVSEEKTDSLSF